MNPFGFLGGPPTRPVPRLLKVSKVGAAARFVQAVKAEPVVPILAICFATPIFAT
jgi:hypothetical protein